MGNPVDFVEDEPLGDAGALHSEGHIRLQELLQPRRRPLLQRRRLRLLRLLRRPRLGLGGEGGADGEGSARPRQGPKPPHCLSHALGTQMQMRGSWDWERHEFMD